MRYPRAEVLIATTWECNLRCTYCFVREQGLSAVGGRMPPDLAARVITALDTGLADVETICVHLYGGEPLLNLTAIEAMVEQARRLAPGRVTFAITTNGTCASPAALDLLARGGFQVILSIDGPAAVHNQCRRTLAGGPSHARVLAFLEALRARTGCWVRASAVVRSGWSLSQAVGYLRSLPVAAIKAQAVRGPAGAPHLLSAEEQAAYLRDLDGVGQQVIEELQAGRAPRDDRFSSRVLQLLAGIRRTSFCGAGLTTFGITPAGDILPCVLMDGNGCRLGHVHDDPPRWRSAGRRWRRARPRRPECRTCSAHPLCGGGCPALMPVCGADECDVIRKNCEVARRIYAHFRSSPKRLLALAGIY